MGGEEGKKRKQAGGGKVDTRGGEERKGEERAGREERKEKEKADGGKRERRGMEIDGKRAGWRRVIPILPPL